MINLSIKPKIEEKKLKPELQSQVDCNRVSERLEGELQAARNREEMQPNT